MQHEDIDHRGSKVRSEIMDTENGSEEDAKEGEMRKEYKEGRKEKKSEAQNYDDKASDVRYVNAHSQDFMLKEIGPFKGKETHQIGFENETSCLQTNKEDNSDERVKEGKIKTGNKEYETDEKAEGKKDDGRLGLTAQSEGDENKIGCKRKEWINEVQDDKEIKTKTNTTRQINTGAWCMTLSSGGPNAQEQEHILDACLNTGSEEALRLSSTFEGSGVNNEMSVVIGGDEKMKQTEEGEIRKMEDDNKETKKSNISSLDMNILPQQNISCQTNPLNGNEEVDQLIVPTLEEVHVPMKPEDNKNETHEEGSIAIIKENTEVKITISPDDDNNDNVISAEDLLCFAWQTAHGMVRPTNLNLRLNLNK